MNHLFPSQVSILGDPPKDVNLPQSAFLNVNNVFPSGEVHLLFVFVLFFWGEGVFCVVVLIFLLGSSCLPE